MKLLSYGSEYIIGAVFLFTCSTEFSRVLDIPACVLLAFVKKEKKRRREREKNTYIYIYRNLQNFSNAKIQENTPKTKYTDFNESSCVCTMDYTWSNFFFFQAKNLFEEIKPILSILSYFEYNFTWKSLL